jgi:methyltransferase
MTAWLALVVFIATQRLAELGWAARNTRRLRAAGAVEIGAAHYPLFVLLHGGWLASLALLVPAEAPLDPALLAVFLLLQAGRLWAIATLGRYWTTRILSVPGAPLVRRGPYRLVRHPNYLVVALEIPVVPLIAGAWQIAIVFGLLNIALLGWRIRIEDRALAVRRSVA